MSQPALSPLWPKEATPEQQYMSKPRAYRGSWSLRLSDLAEKKMKETAMGVQIEHPS